jgi:hypothetical protein
LPRRRVSHSKKSSGSTARFRRSKEFVSAIRPRPSGAP